MKINPVGVSFFWKDFIQINNKIHPKKRSPSLAATNRSSWVNVTGNMVLGVLWDSHTQNGKTISRSQGWGLLDLGYLSTELCPFRLHGTDVGFLMVLIQFLCLFFFKSSRLSSSRLFWALFLLVTSGLTRFFSLSIDCNLHLS